MDSLMYTVVPLIGGLVIYFIIQVIVRAPGSVKQAQFSALGVVKGKTYAEIVQKCGAPSSVSMVATGKLCQWISTGYHICLLFDENDICLGISSETKV